MGVIMSEATDSKIRHLPGPVGSDIAPEEIQSPTDDVQHSVDVIKEFYTAFVGATVTGVVDNGKSGLDRIMGLELTFPSENGSRKAIVWVTRGPGEYTKPGWIELEEID